MTNENNKSKDNIRSKLLEALPKAIFVFLVFAFGIWVGQNVALPFSKPRAPIIRVLNKNAPGEVQVDFKNFWQIWDSITTDYLEKNKLDSQKLLYGAISGLVQAVGDPYTVFLDPGENKEFELSLSGIYEGVGIELDVRDDKLTVVSPLSGTPAEKEGVLPGDKILEIDGEDTTGLNIQQAVKKIRGQAGTKVKLRLERGSKTFEITLTRTKIVIKSVEFKDLGNAAAYLKVSRFGDNTQKEWNDAVSKVVTGGFKKLILDLRNDPGGRLDYAIEIAGDFVSKGTTVVSEEDASGKRAPLRTEKEGRLRNIKTIVLINKGSASAAEIVAGALRDALGIKLVGETSFGKGTVQRVDELPDGSGLHITFAKWLTPAGIWVHKIGLKPDIEVKMTEDDIKAGRDPQLGSVKELLK